MGDETRAVSDPRGRDRRRDPYTEAELGNLGVRGASIEICDKVGLALARIDGTNIHLSRLAEHWIGTEVNQFEESTLLRAAARTTDPDAQWDYACETGRVLRIRRADHGDKIWLFFHDATLEADHRKVMENTADIGVGFLHHSPATSRTHVFGTLVDQHLSPNEQLELRRSHFRSIIHKRDKAKFDAAMHKLVSDGVPINTVFECGSRKTESFRIQLCLTPVKSSSGNVVKAVGGFRDVTLERKAQAELIRTRNEHEANREARRYMIARIAHEVRTPMNGVLGIAEVLERRSELPEDVQDMLRIMSDAARDSIRQIENLMGSNEQGTLTSTEASVDMTRLLNDAAGLWRARATEKGVLLKLTIHGDVPERLELDGAKLRQCLNNILSNATKFTQRGSIQIAYAVIGAAEQRQVVIAVKDTGIGMSDSELSSMFVPFQQANETIRDAFGGSGLGMSITRGLARELGGDVSAKSAKGAGTTVTLRLPFKEASSVAPTSSQLVDDILHDVPSIGGPFAHLRVLAVDDNATNRLVVEQLLKDSVCSVTTAADGREALRKLDTQPFDVVLMDIHMPVMDGIEAALAIRQSGAGYSDIPIIALTADSQYQQKRVVMNIGMDDAMAKPVALSQMLSAFDRLGLAQNEDVAA